ncbi:hypothetical protein [Pseudomonas sp. MWU12-2323]|uniref:hypothetical protein n=1 Tax=Pseudomonas sp. MWU12-2323 TaxID=2651296 RepID=UPI00128E1985|nr:hypothetical protein [Pseudomonas sp. MWU12-2323]MPQ71520.1 hypothetical protein [Pseudomonas sp. MWU12-2323]
MTDEERQKYIVLKLQDLEIQIEKLKTVEPKSIGQAGLEDDIKSRLNDLQAMQALTVAERNAIDWKVRTITSTKSSMASDRPVGGPVGFTPFSFED